MCKVSKNNFVQLVSSHLKNLDMFKVSKNDFVQLVDSHLKNLDMFKVSKNDFVQLVSSHLKSNHPNHNYGKKIMSHNIRMLNLSLNELKLVAKSRGIKDYENKSEDDLIKIVSELKTKRSLSKKKIKSIKEKFNKSRY